MAPAAVPVAIVAALLVAASACGEQQADPQAATQPAPPPPEAALLVTDLVKGVGDEAFPGMNVIVHYTGWLYDPGAKDFRGKQFDSSRERGQPLSFPLGAGRVIRGWEQGIPGMKIGGTRRLDHPAQPRLWQPQRRQRRNPPEFDAAVRSRTARRRVDHAEDRSIRLTSRS